MLAPISAVQSIIFVTLVVSVGYVLLGGYILRAHTGRGVLMLGGFALLWGVGNGLINAMDLYLSAVLGITTQAEFAAAALSQRVELSLAAGTFFSVLLITVAPFAWTGFVLNYTTRLQQTHRRLYAGIVVVVTCFVVFFTGPSILNVLGFELGVADGFLFLTGLVVVGSQIGVSGAGVAQLYKVSQRNPRFETAEAFAVAAPLLVLFNNAANNFGLYGRFVGLYSVYLLLHLLGIGGLLAAVERYSLLDQLPAVSAIGRDAATDTLDLGIMVIDDRGRITDLNEAARSLFDARGEWIGTAYQQLHPSLADVDLSTEGRTTFRVPERGRILEADTTVTSDRYGRLLGAAVAFYDITDQKHRQERIQVLNRVLRHNLRNELTGASGYTQLLDDNPECVEEYAERIAAHHERLLSISAKAQRIERLLEAERDAAGSAALSAIVDNSIDEVESDLDTTLPPDRLDVSVPDDYSLSINPLILQRVLSELLENAVQHGDDPEISIAFDASASALTVADTGPGIPDLEIETLRSGEETPTKHGQGLGLWLIKWGVDRLGGSIDIETDESGTRVTVGIPEAHLETR
jgi:signal transduction histidine kinase